MGDDGGVDAAPTSLLELAALFGRLGATAFGGPAAHIAMMRDEVVVRRGWLTEAQFLDLVGAVNLIPGPNSTELAIHIGWARRRWAGLVVAGVCFIAPAMLATGLLGWAYVRFGRRPTAVGVLWGGKPVVVAVVVQALWKLAPTAARTWPLRIVGCCAAVAAALGANELVILLGAGVLLVGLRAQRWTRAPGGLAQMVPLVPAAGVAGAASAAFTLTGLFAVFLKVGAVLFGSGYVLLAFLRANLVVRLHWLSEAQLLDAIAAGQVTPGPVFTTATFVGYVLAGTRGALVATAGIFLPAFVFVAASGPLVPRLRASRLAGAFLDGVNVGSLALMAVVTVELGRAALIDIPTVVLAVAAVVALVRFRVNATWLMLGGAALGVGARFLGLSG
jgi:chromate transporter